MRILIYAMFSLREDGADLYDSRPGEIVTFFSLMINKAFGVTFCCKVIQYVFYFFYTQLKHLSEFLAFSGKFWSCGA